MVGAVEALIEREVGGRFTVRESTVTVTAASTQIMRADPERTAWAIVNTGAVLATIGFGASEPATDTIPLTANGGGMSATVREDFTLPTFPVFGIVLVGTTTIRVVEIMRVSA